MTSCLSVWPNVLSSRGTRVHVFPVFTKNTTLMSNRDVSGQFLLNPFSRIFVLRNLPLSDILLMENDEEKGFYPNKFSFKQVYSVNGVFNTQQKYILKVKIFELWLSKSDSLLY